MVRDAQCSLTEDHRVFCQGRDNYGLLGPDHHLAGGGSSYYDSRAPVEIYEPNELPWTSVGSTFTAVCASNSDNNILCWGNNGLSTNSFATISNLPSANVSQIIGTQNAFCALF